MPTPTLRLADQEELEELSGQMIPLTSSTVNSVQYDREEQTLDVTFTSGRTYTLNGVPPDIFLGLVHASSPGRYFNENLKGKYVWYV